MKISAAICLLAAHFAVGSAFPPPRTCQISDTDPKPDWSSIPKAVINLDQAPADRWTALATSYSTEVAAMVNEFVDHLSAMPGDKWEVIRKWLINIFCFNYFHLIYLSITYHTHRRHLLNIWMKTKTRYLVACLTVIKCRLIAIIL